MTDYEQYSVVYNCMDNYFPFFGGAKHETIWVISRTRKVKRELAEKIWSDTIDIINKYRGDDFWKMEDMDNYMTELYQENDDEIDWCIYDQDFKS